MVEKLPQSVRNVIGFRMCGKLTQTDYEQFVPQVEAIIEQFGKARFLVHFDRFEGWELSALWEDIKFATQHIFDIERIAMVGQETWQEWMAKVCSPFTKATVRYFEASELDEAWAWIFTDIEEK